METFLRSKHAFIKYALFGIGFVLLAAGSFGCRAKAKTLDAQLIESVEGGGSLQVIKNLLARGASVNARGIALVWAARNGHAEIVQLLLDNGANMLRRAWDEAEGAGNKEITRIISAAANALSTQLIESAGKGDLLQVKNLLERVSDVNFKNVDGLTALIVAAKNGKKEVVQLLLDKGADRKIKDKSGNTAADYAKDPAIAAALLK